MYTLYILRHAHMLSMCRHAPFGKTTGMHQDMRAAMRGHASLAPKTAAARAIEPGALIVAAPRGSTQAVLQLPRGNLEAVSHRILVMALIEAALQVHVF